MICIFLPKCNVWLSFATILTKGEVEVLCYETYGKYWVTNKEIGEINGDFCVVYSELKKKHKQRKWKSVRVSKSLIFVSLLKSDFKYTNRYFKNHSLYY